MFPRSRSPAPAVPEIPPEAERRLHHSVDPFPATPWRRRLLLVALAVGMGWMVVTTMVDPPGSLKRNPPPRLDAPRCTPGQTEGCVGGTVSVIVAPPAPAASR